MPIRCNAILFDMDGTLVDSNAVVERAWNWWAERHRLSLAEILLFAHGRPTESTMKHFLPGVDVAEETAEMERFEDKQRDAIVAICGALEAVTAARQGGSWGVVTSAPRELAERRLAAAGLPVPQVLIGADMVKRGKPDPEGFLQAARMLNAAPAKCVVFEDTRPGLDAGEAAGMIVIGMLTTFSQAQLGCEFAIRDFGEIRIENRGPEFFIHLQGAGQ